VRRLAVVESLNAMNRMGIEDLLSEVVPGTTRQQHYFSTMQEARAWAMEAA